MTSISVPVAEITFKTVPLSAKIFRQIPVEGYTDRIKAAITVRDTVLGWIDEKGITPGAYGYWLIIRMGEGEYVRFKCHPETCKKFSQLYLV